MALGRRLDLIIRRRLNEMELLQHWQNIIFSLGMFLYALWQIRQSLAEGKREQLHWRIAYAIAFCIGFVSFLHTERHTHRTWHPPSLSELVSWPAILLWLFLAVGLYAVLGEWYSKRSRRKHLRADVNSTAT